MKEPKTYIGYGEEKNEITRRTAKDARNDIDPDEIKAKAENAETVVDECMDSISKSLDGVVNDTENALVVGGKSMAPSIEAANESVKATQTSIKNMIKSDELYSKAVEKHDELQDKYNLEAHRIVESTHGVTRINSC